MISNIYFGKVYLGTKADVECFQRAVHNSAATARFDQASSELDECRWLMKKGVRRDAVRGLRHRHRTAVKKLLSARNELKSHIEELARVFRVVDFHAPASRLVRLADFILYKIF